MEKEMKNLDIEKDERPESPVNKKEKSKVYVAMNYIIILIIVLGIGFVLYKQAGNDSNLEALTGGLAADPWCQLHQSMEDCKKECTEKASFEEYQTCFDSCIKKLDDCKIK